MSPPSDDPATKQIEIRIGTPPRNLQTSLYIGVLPLSAFHRFTRTIRALHHTYNTDTFWLPLGTDPHAAKTLIRWISWNLNQRHPLPIPHPETFEEAVELLAAARTFHVKAYFTEMLRGNLMEYMRGAALTCEEFRLGWEKLAEDDDVAGALVGGLRERYRDGLRWGFEGVPERRMIVNFTEAKGIVVWW
ncbi:hypothetical protein CERZMDRAFT_102007 [Cercospora zeae-maydis SCOH1-5]|uniref:Uncharacterized protein n=1 Tax=Cercospora zeae-maydis SCOH1-5 TaxID=717836 RepID=A0A6A6F1S8_9PEZI|nr:hypothetical protein CERZMDRAFT_102007 [Cercospora zeae-maydis SCOH1-5]